MVQKSLTSHETVASARRHGSEGWDPQEIDYAFTAWLMCSNKTCEQRIAVAGIGGVEPEYYPEDGTYSYEDCYYPRYLFPMPAVIDIPKLCPEEVSSHLKAGFSLIFVDQAGAANKIRISLERLMDHFGVQTRKKNKQNKYYDLSLHARLEIYGKKNPAIVDHLLAIKWLGNTGSHEGALTMKDLLDGLEVLEHVLGELIDKRSAKIKDLADRLTAKHGGKKGRKRK